LIGDVAGKGLQAAIQVAAVRYAVRSYAYLNSSPGIVMTLVNELICKDEKESALITAVYAVVDTAECTLAYASAGHEPPLMRNSSGHVQELVQGGRALGIYGGFTYTEACCRVSPGETLVIVTDGITEARSGNIFFGQEGVKEFLSSHPTYSASETSSGLLEAATAHAGGALQDDAAIVVIEVL
jgi:serine phosphatase RsbU (regulator of sigma subunit)